MDTTSFLLCTADRLTFFHNLKTHTCPGAQMEVIKITKFSTEDIYGPRLIAHKKPPSVYILVTLNSLQNVC